MRYGKTVSVFLTSLCVAACTQQPNSTAPATFEARSLVTSPNSVVMPYYPVTTNDLPIRNSIDYNSAQDSQKSDKTADSKSTNTVSNSKKTIVVIGDSLTAPSAERMRKFSNERCEFIIDADYGRSTAEALDVLSLLKPKYEKTDSEDLVFVIALGSNDGSQEETYKERFTSVVKATPDGSRVYWLTTFRSAPLYSQFKAVAAVAKESRRVYILDWALQMQNNPSIIKSDGTHLTEGGYRFRSDFVKLHTCDNPAP